MKKPSKDLRPKAPGMKYRHYAPRAELTILKGSPEAVTRTILERGKAGMSEGKRVGVICTRETMPAFSGLVVKCIGSRKDEEAIAHNPVSYTHLDVYKRQAHTHMRRPPWPLWRSRPYSCPPLHRYPKVPLDKDVYKRQS